METRKGKKRSIRIKDFGTGAVLKKSPDDAYMKMVNSSLSQGSFWLTTDSNGFIIDPSCQDGGDAPVFVFGDSVVESTFIQQGRRFCDLLTKKMAAEGCPRQFLNGGYSGATSLILLNAMINKVGCQENAAVLLILPSNDTLAMGFKGGLWNSSSQRYSPVLPTDGQAEEACPAEKNLHQLESVLRSFACTADAFSLDLYFATTPFVQTNYSDQPWYQARFRKTPGRYERLVAARRLSNQVMRNVARATRVELLDLEKLISDISFFYDDLHLNEVGSAALSETIYAQIGSQLALVHAARNEGPFAYSKICNPGE